MIKLMKTGLATLIAATSIAAAASPASAEGHYGHGGYGYGGYGGYGGERWEHHDHDDAAPWIIGGILGLGLLAAVASSSHSNHAQTQTYDNGPNDGSSVNNHPDVCTQQRQVWDPNSGEYSTHNYRVAC